MCSQQAFGTWLACLDTSDNLASYIKDVFVDEIELHGWTPAQFKTPRSTALMFKGAINEYLTTFARLAHAWGGGAGLDQPDPLPPAGRHHATDPDQSPVTAEELTWAGEAITAAKVLQPRISRWGLNSAEWNRHEDFTATDEALTEIALSRRWLSLVRPSNRYFMELSSYGLKHVVEEWQQQYIANGSFLVAALAMGYKYRLLGGLNASIGLNASDVQSLLWRMNYTRRRERSCCR